MGVAGASAAAKAESLKDGAVRHAQKQWGDHAAAVAAQIVADDPSVRAWDKGGKGEYRLAAFIQKELGNNVIGLHDRLIPGTRHANIDHLFIGPSGVWVVDAKSYKGKVEKREVGPFWREELELRIGGRNRTNLADGLKLQLKAVRAALEPDPECAEVTIRCALCFVDSEWGVFARPFEIHGVAVLYPGALRDRLRKSGSLERETMERVATRLALSLPPAHE